MEQTLTRLRLLFLGLFALAAAASWTYHILWVKPEQECLARGAWWSNKKRVCATPIDITAITGRPRADAAPAPAPVTPKAPQP